MSKKVRKKFKVIVTLTSGKKIEAIFTSHAKACDACSAMWVRRTDIATVNIKDISKG